MMQIAKYIGSLFQLTIEHVTRKDGTSKFFEKAVRPPGVRMIFKNADDEILLSREFRRELDSWDFRLPGGKVFDDIGSFIDANDLELEQALLDAVIRESLEEVGLIVTSPNCKLIHKSVAGSSIHWDLYYYLISDFEFSENGQSLEEGEIIDKPSFYSLDKIISMCLNGDINEDRSVAVLLRLLKKNIV